MPFPAVTVIEESNDVVINTGIIGRNDDLTEWFDNNGGSYMDALAMHSEDEIVEQKKKAVFPSEKTKESTRSEKPQKDEDIGETTKSDLPEKDENENEEEHQNILENEILMNAIDHFDSSEFPSESEEDSQNEFEPTNLKFSSQLEPIMEEEEEEEHFCMESSSTIKLEVMADVLADFQGDMDFLAQTATNTTENSDHSETEKQIAGKRRMIENDEKKMMMKEKVEEGEGKEDFNVMVTKLVINKKTKKSSTTSGDNINKLKSVTDNKKPPIRPHNLIELDKNKVSRRKKKLSPHSPNIKKKVEVFVKSNVNIEEMVMSPFPETIDEFSFTRPTFTPTETPESEKEEEKEEIKVPICPDWYTNMTFKKREQIEKLLGQYTSNNQKLVDKLMKRFKRSRIDCNKLSIWWFYQIQLKEEKLRLNENEKKARLKEKKKRLNEEKAKVYEENTKPKKSKKKKRTKKKKNRKEPEVIVSKKAKKEEPSLPIARKTFNERMEATLSQRRTINAFDLSLRNPLFWASREGQTDVVKNLLDARADVNFQDENNRTCLMIAIQRRNCDVVVDLIEENADVTQCDSEMNSPLLWASKNGDGKTVNILLEELFLKRKIDTLDEVNEHDQTPLYWAVMNGHRKIVSALIEAGSCVNIADALGCTPIWWAAKLGRREIVELLIASRAALNVSDSRQTTPIYWACRNGLYKIVKILLEEEVDMDLPDTEGVTCINLVARYGHIDIMRQLIEAEGDVNQQDNLGNTPIYWAAREGHVKILKMLLNHRADPTISNEYSQNALFWASKLGHSECINILIRHMNFQNEDKMNFDDVHSKI